jgi:hypothetical protein
VEVFVVVVKVLDSKQKRFFHARREQMRLTSRVHVATSRSQVEPEPREEKNFYVETKFMIFLCAFGEKPNENLQPINITTNFQLINLPSLSQSRAASAPVEEGTWKYRDNVVEPLKRL